MYTVKELADTSGVSSRTLRYYDAIDLLKPAETSPSGYRLYNETSVDRLQHILFYKELGLPLKEIKELLDDPAFDEVKALESHRVQLIEERIKLKRLIKTIDLTLLNKKGMSDMSDSEKFEGFKKEMIEENTTRYGTEIKSAYGSKQVTKANKQMMNMSEKDYYKWKALEESVITLLKNYLEKEFLSKDEKVELGRVHREWLSFTWDSYSKDMHRGLAEMYLADERFTAYYDDQAGKGAARVLVDAVNTYIDELD